MSGRVERPGEPKSLALLWANAAHDLRQPVQAALLVARALEAEGGGAEERRAARHLATALSSLCEMIEVLALLSRIEAGLQVVQLRNCRLSAVLEPTMREMAELAAQKGICLRHTNMQGVVRSNPNLLVVATRSLLLNAMMFGDGDAITVRCRRRDSRLWLEVQFKGDAPDGEQSRNAFVQIPPSANRRSGGKLGLGLCLVEHLCSRLGHRLRCAKLASNRHLLSIELLLAPAPD